MRHACLSPLWYVVLSSYTAITPLSYQIWNRYCNYCRIVTVCPGCKQTCISAWWAEPEMELGQMDCEASRCAVCSMVLWSGWLTSAGWKEESGVKEENTPALLWLPGILTIFLSNLVVGGSRLIHLTCHTTGACSCSSNFACPSFKASGLQTSPGYKDT